MGWVRFGFPDGHFPAMILGSEDILFRFGSHLLDITDFHCISVNWWSEIWWFLRWSFVAREFLSRYVGRHLAQGSSVFSSSSAVGRCWVLPLLKVQPIHGDSAIVKHQFCYTHSRWHSCNLAAGQHSVESRFPTFSWLTGRMNCNYIRETWLVISKTKLSI